MSRSARRQQRAAVAARDTAPLFDDGAPTAAAAAQTAMARNLYLPNRDGARLRPPAASFAAVPAAPALETDPGRGASPGGRGAARRNGGGAAAATPPPAAPRVASPHDAPIAAQTGTPPVGEAKGWWAWVRSWTLSQWLCFAVALFLVYGASEIAQQAHSQARLVMRGSPEMMEEACRHSWTKNCPMQLLLHMLPCRAARWVCGCSPHHFRHIAHTPATIDRHGTAEVLLVRHLYHLFRTRLDPHTFLGINTTAGLFRGELMPCGFLLTGPWQRSKGCCANRGDPDNYRNGTWRPKHCQRWCAPTPGKNWGEYENKRPRPGWTLREYGQYINSSWTLTFNCWTLSRTAYDATETTRARKRWSYEEDSPMWPGQARLAKPGGP